MILEKLFNLRNNFGVVLEKLDLLLNINEQNSLDYNDKLTQIINKINNIEIKINNLQNREIKSDLEFTNIKDINFKTEKKYNFDEVEKFIPENNSKFESKNFKTKNKKYERKLDIDKLSNIIK